MSKLRAGIEPTRNDGATITRLGNESIEVWAETWEGRITVELHADEHFSIWFSQHGGRGWKLAATGKFERDVAHMGMEPEAVLHSFPTVGEISTVRPQR